MPEALTVVLTLVLIACLWRGDERMVSNILPVVAIALGVMLSRPKS